MISKNKQSRLAGFRILLAIPTAFVLLSMFSFISIEKATEDNPLFVVEQNPEFQGGYSAMLKYLSEKIHFPELAKQSGIHGTVFVQFVVGKTGKVSKAKILRSIGGGCDEEALRVIKEMPDWIPGKQDGQNVPARFHIPVKFQLQKN